MSIVNMFRKEALKQQYKSQEFGEAVVEHPAIIGQGIWLLIICLTLFCLAILVVPLITSKNYIIHAHESNFKPIVFPYPVIIDKHYITDGAKVNSQILLSQLRFYSDGQLTEKYQSIRSNGPGIFFASAEVGTTVKALDPIAKLLLNSKTNQYEFWLESNEKIDVNSNQIIQLTSGQHTVKGKIISILSPLKGKSKLTISLKLPYNKSILNPNLPIQLTVKQRRNNIFDLLREK